ncbi:unnamed protein product [Spodoptera exigua]|nr:unnamed protein product [Spodoptera exigua]
MPSYYTMSKDQFCFSWVSHKNQISQGFARLQQEGEFVDMTLAADGHLVKVHQNIIALASPYIKAMIQSAACQHPVVFLNNINYNTLSSILEYIYTGEVNIPADVTPDFLQACKALCIKGVEKIDLPKKQPFNTLPSVPQPSGPPLPNTLLSDPPSQPTCLGLDLPPLPHSLGIGSPPERPTIAQDNNFAAHITINSENYNVEVIPSESNIMQQEKQSFYSLGEIELMNFPTLTSSTAVENQNIEQIAPLPEMNIVETDFEYVDASVPVVEENQTEFLNSNNLNIVSNEPVTVFNLNSSNLPPATKVTHGAILGKNAHRLHYSISKRGALQLILNQYIYHCHHHSDEGLKRRWRCVDYRKLHCPAYIDTCDNKMVNRSENHNHGEHKTEIKRKLKSKIVFTSITQATNKIIDKEKPKKIKRTSNTSLRTNQIIKNGEFVDMTIAADGHLVKVHQVLVALASPYLKDLISSAPCQHPVIFLNNVSHPTLCLLLEYIYTGEAVVPADCLNMFVEAAKSLHIRGLENISSSQNQTSMPQLDDSDMCHVSGIKRLGGPPTESTAQVALPSSARKVSLKQDSTVNKDTSLQAAMAMPVSSQQEQHGHHDYSDLMDDSEVHDDDNDTDFQMQEPKQNVQEKKDAPSGSNLQFTVSIRGSLQVILNRYIYNLHSAPSRSGLRRWRCVDYRNNKCTASLVTKGNVVLNRANLHNHPFHDKKILSKIEKKAVYSTIDQVEGYKEDTNEHSDISTLKEFPDDTDPKNNHSNVKG